MKCPDLEFLFLWYIRTTLELFWDLLIGAGLLVEAMV
jgi:hypothetical protein